MRCPAADTVVAYLAAKPGDPARASVDEHIEQCPSCRRLIHVLASRDIEISRPLPSDDFPAQATVSQRVGRYVLDEILGAGAMGIVYRAWDPELRRDVAVKLLRPHQTPPGARSVVDEARAMAAVQHPNVVTIYDVGSIDGRVYIAMELVHGVTLRQWWAAKKPGWRDIVAVLLQAGEGLAAAHRAGLVHGDFKPDNILVADTPPDGRVPALVRVADFGLATYAGTIESRPVDDGRMRAQDGGPAPRTHGETRPRLVGSPAYMAPELLRGGTACAASDQYALCVTLFEGLHGTRPFQGEDLQSLRDAMLAERIDVERAGQVPATIHAAIRRGLAADPTARHADVGALLGTLRRTVAPPSRWRSAASVVAVAGVATAGLVWSAARGHEPAPCPLDVAAVDTRWAQAQTSAIAQAVQRDRPTAREATALVLSNLERWTATWRTQAQAVCAAPQSDPPRLGARVQCLADRQGEFVGLLAALDDPGSTGAAIDRALRLELPACGESPVTAPVPEPLRAALVRLRVANWTARHAKAASDAADLLAAHQDVADPAFVAAVRAELGRAQVGVGDAQAGIATLERAVLDARAAGADDLVAATGTALVMWLSAAGRNDEADVWLRHVESAAAGTLERAPWIDAAVNYAAGAVAHRRRDFPEARRRYEAAISTFEAALGPSNATSYEVMDALARLDFDEGHMEAALAGFERALAVAEATWGLEHPETASLAINMTPLLHATGQGARAEGLLRAALAGQRRILGPDNPALATTLMQLGLLAMADGEHASAIGHLQACVDLHRGMPDAPDALTCRLNLAQAQMFTGDCPGALVHYTGLVDAYDAVAQGDQYLQETAIALHGEAYCRLHDDPRSADALLARLEDLATALADPVLLAEAKFYRAQARWALGDHGVATVALAQRAAELLGKASTDQPDPQVAMMGAQNAVLPLVEAWLREHPITP